MLATACSNDEVVNVAPQSAAIGFSSFADNATRYGATDLPANLQVYAVSNNTTTNVDPFIVFNGDVVTNEGSKWSYSPLRYWIPTNNYTFAAVAPANAKGVVVTPTTAMVAGGISLITFDNATPVEVDGETVDTGANGDIDLMYAAYEEATNVAANRAAVDFTLGHLLSRVKFEFTNAMPKGHTLTVKDVKITNAVSKATIDKAAGATKWTAVEVNNAEVTSSYDFAMVNGEKFAVGAKPESVVKYLIPVTAAKAYTATFTVELYTVDGNNNPLWIGSYDHSVAVPSIEFTPSYSYVLKAAINKDNFSEAPEEVKPI